MKILHSALKATNYAKNMKDIEIVERVITYYEVFQTNFGHIYPMEFENFYDAVKYGESKGFEFHVVRHNPNNTTDVLAYWSPIGGLRFLEIDGDI